jgi:hypothetical protein
MLIDTSVTLTVEAPIALVPGRTLPEKYMLARKENPQLPEPAQIAAEINRLGCRDGVPVVLDPQKGWLRLFTQRGCLGVRPTRHGDAFAIEFVQAMTLRNHGSLSRGRLRVMAPAWVYFRQLGDVPPGYRAPDPQIRVAWQRSLRQPPPAEKPRRYDAFCDALDLVIEGGRQIEAAADPGERILPHYEVRSTARPRRTAAGVYDFLLSRPGAVHPGAMVQLRNEPDLRGRVRAVDGERLTVGFDTTVDRRRIPERGELVLAANDVVPRVQADAVARLRSGTASNPRLAGVLVDGMFADYAEQPVEPADPLDENQTVALRRALAVPDLLCVAWAHPAPARPGPSCRSPRPRWPVASGSWSRHRPTPRWTT